jgi:hypothetical protein
MMVARSMARAERAQKTEDINTAVFAIADMLDIVDSLIIDESDRDEFVRLMSIGQLEVSELMTAIHDARQEQQAPPAPAKPRVRRGSAR